MQFLADTRAPKRRKTDKQVWEQTIDLLAQSLCPEAEWAAYRNRQRTIARMGDPAVKVFPVWKKYRAQAVKVATVQRAVPMLRHLPPRFSWVLGEVFLK